MNSSLQILFMNPILRQIIYDLPLCSQDDIHIASDFIEQNQKYDILIAVQKLFCKLQFLNINSISTINLTESFKWQASDGSNQQDSQEFIRLFLFEILERILIGTPYDGYINNLFKVLTKVNLKCSECSFVKSREEVNLDIVLPVKDINGVENSLKELFNNEETISDFLCQNCNKKVNLLKSTKISNLPPFLNFPLNKFDFDLETFERIKLNSKYEFPLELDMKEYLSEEDYFLSIKEKNKSNDASKSNLEIDKDIWDKEETKYELYGIIIHRGTPYSGHYFSYIRDLNKEGFWNLNEVKEYLNEPIKPEEKKDEDNNQINENEVKNNNTAKNSNAKSNNQKRKKNFQNHNQNISKKRSNIILLYKLNFTVIILFKLKKSKILINRLLNIIN